MKARFATGGKGGLVMFVVTAMAGTSAGCNHSIDALTSIDASRLDSAGDGGDASDGDAASDGSTTNDGGDGSTPSVCDMLAAMYETELPLAKVCSPAATLPQCQITAAEPIGCPCKTEVQDDTHLQDIVAQWTDAGCAPICPPSCPSVQSGVCQLGTGGSGTGTCEDVP